MRARNIKPGLFKNEDLGTADPFLTILFEGLWCLADREGRLEDRPKRIKAEIFPYRNFVEAKVDAMLTELKQLGFIRRYEVNGQAIIQCTKFVKHQSPHKTEKPSELPPEPLFIQQVTEITVEAPLDNGELTEQERSDSLIPDSLNTDLLITETPQQIAERVFVYWQQVHNKPKAQFTTDRKTKVRARLADSTIEEIFEAIDGCKVSPIHQGQNDRNTVYDDLELICRSRTYLEKFIGYKHQRENGNATTQQRQFGNGSKPTNAEIIRNRSYYKTPNPE